MKALIVFLVTLAGIIGIIVIGYWYYTFQVVKPSCLAKLDEKMNSATISFSSSQNATEAKVRDYVAAARDIGGVTKVEEKQINMSSETNIWRVDAYYKSPASEQQILSDMKKLTITTGLQNLLIGTNRDEYQRFRAQFAERKFSPKWLVYEIMYLPLVFTKSEPTILAPPLRLFTLCARGEI